MNKSLAACPEAVHDAVDQLLRPVLLHDSAARGALAALAELLTRDFDINTPNHNTGRTCLYVAMASSSVETVRWLITRGVNVHQRDKYGDTAVSASIRGFACLFVYLVLCLYSESIYFTFYVYTTTWNNCVFCLLVYLCVCSLAHRSINQSINRSINQLVYAIRLLVYTKDIQRTVECIRLLKDAGSSLCGMRLTENVLHFSQVGNVDILKMIHECNGSLDCADHSGKSVLHIAALHGQMDVIRWVAKKPGLRYLFSRRDKYRKTALDDARLLLAAGAGESCGGSSGGGSGSSVSDDGGGGGLSAAVLREVIAALEQGGGHSQDNECTEVGGLVEF
jgi:ankyrin repeat protein